MVMAREGVLIYENDMVEGRKMCRTNNVNMLLPCYKKGKTTLWVEEKKEDEVEESELVIWDKEVTKLWVQI